jgi:hypothetical protein
MNQYMHDQARLYVNQLNKQKNAIPTTVVGSEKNLSTSITHTPMRWTWLALVAFLMRLFR